MTSAECAKWLRVNCGLECQGEPPLVKAAFETMITSPREAGRKAFLARTLVEWMGTFDSAMLWLTDWPFCQQDEMAIVSGMRRSHGEERRLIDAPGHVFDRSERTELTAWVSLILWFEWDGHVFTSPYHGEVVHASHHDEVWVTSSDEARSDALREGVGALGLSIR